MDSHRQEQYHARFGGIGRLYGSAGLERLREAHVCVVGVGGVGSWAVEALARSGIGTLTLIDLDDVCISNVNRQVHALDGELGKPKVEVLERRVRAINPACQVHAVRGFFVKTTADQILETRFDFVLDAIDSPSLKALLIASCRARNIPVITTGAAGGRRDPTAIEVIDLAFTSHDHLLQEVRRKLRRRHGFPRGDQAFGVECVLSREPVVYPSGGGCDGIQEEPDLRLDCQSGFGTTSFVTGTFGLVAVSRIIGAIAERACSPQILVQNSPQPGPPDRPVPCSAALLQTGKRRTDLPDDSAVCQCLGRSVGTGPVPLAGTDREHLSRSADAPGART
jgi:tRNA A37 threonylcarbamoyladenosine dehydratase